jgi:L-methionine (R)-S-oxide reductase
LKKIIGVSPVLQAIMVLEPLQVEKIWPVNIYCALLRCLKVKQAMSEDLHIAKGSKEEQYQSLLPQIKGLLEGETDLIANLANITAALKEQFGWLWVGFYLVRGDELVLGPFQGPVACTRIRKGRGVCGTSWAEAKTLVVPDVEKFPGHIACSSLSRSEIVLPVIRNNQVVAVLDVDSEKLGEYGEIDKRYLEQVIAFLIW